MTLASGGIRCSRLWSTSQLLCLSGQQAVTPAGSVHKSNGDNVGEEMMCVMCVCYRGGIVVMDVICVNMIYLC